MKLVIVPDSFKGTLSAVRICEIVAEQAQIVFPGCEVASIPAADGGEGSVDCFLTALDGERRSVVVNGPFFESVEASYAMIGDTAVIEMAACAGLPLAEGRRDPEKTTTYGLGEIILHAARSGAKKIIVGLGGSCTNDGGCGAAAAVGVRFYNGEGNTFVPTGGTLKDIAKIDTSGLDHALSGIEITAMCDVDNPMYGEKGAAYVFAPQKGADGEMVQRLDDGLRHLSSVILRDCTADVSGIPGAGAAGALGAGIMAFFGGKLKRGIDTVLDTVRFDDVIRDADLIITGEGKLDSQSLGGKVISGVADRAKHQNKPVIAIVGGADANISAVYDAGITAVFTINRLPEDLSVSRYKSEENLRSTCGDIFRLIKEIKK